jgi:hypothetical protein
VVSPPLLENAQNFFAPTVSRGAVTLAPSLLSNEQQFYAPTVTQDGQEQFIFPLLLTNVQTFHAPTVAHGSQYTRAPAGSGGSPRLNDIRQFSGETSRPARFTNTTRPRR